MNRAMEALTGTIVKRYRVYERLFDNHASGKAEEAGAQPFAVR